MTPADFQRERRTLQNIALHFTEIGAELADAARSLANEQDETRLRGAVLGLSDRLAHLGDTAHLARHALRDLALWAPGRPLDRTKLANLLEGASQATVEIPREISLRVTTRVQPAWKRAIKRWLKL